MTTDQPIRLAEAPSMEAALEGALAIPTCRVADCDDDTVPFTDVCDTHLTGPREAA